MAGECVEKLPHSCGTRDGLQVFDKGGGKYDGYCFACNTPIADPYKDKPKGYVPPKPKEKSPEEIQQELEEVGSCPTLDLPTRGLKKEYLEYFGVKVGVNEMDGVTPSIAYFPYVVDGEVRYKARALDVKKMWGVGKLKGAEPFGWREALDSGAHTLIITEGEFDAVALFQMMKESNKHNPEFASFNPAVISLPSGASSAKATVAKYMPKIRGHFKKVVLAFDMDEPGNKAAEEVATVYPTAHRADLPEKDPNECLLKGKKKACVSAVTYKSSVAKNSRLVRIEDIFDEAKEQAPWGVSWPWPKLTELTRGIRTGETYYLGAAQKMGKSEVVNSIAAHLIKEHGWKVLLAKPEEANKKTTKMLAGKIAGRVFHDPKVEFDFDAYEATRPILNGKVLMVDLYQHLGWESLKDDIIAASSEGAKAIFIDPITNLTNGMSPTDTNTKLQEVSQEIAAMSKDLDFAAFIFCHLNKPPKGSIPHDRGGKITTDMFAGSSAMGRSCNYMFGLEGNKDPDLSEMERNKRTLVVLDDREYGEVGKVELFWDKHTSLFNQIGG